MRVGPRLISHDTIQLPRAFGARWGEGVFLGAPLQCGHQFSPGFCRGQFIALWPRATQHHVGDLVLSAFQKFFERLRWALPSVFSELKLGMRANLFDFAGADQIQGPATA